MQTQKAGRGEIPGGLLCYRSRDVDAVLRALAANWRDIVKRVRLVSPPNAAPRRIGAVAQLEVVERVFCRSLDVSTRAFFPDCQYMKLRRRIFRILQRWNPFSLFLYPLIPALNVLCG